jgi:serine protease inhibitor
MKNYIFILFSVLIGLTFSCSKNDTPGDPGVGNPLQIELAEGSDLVLESMNEFGLDMFRLLTEDEEPGTNIFISPTSISLALAMTLNGANTTTEDSMAYAMRVDHLTADQINETYRDLIDALTTCDDKVILEIANSIWYRMGYPVLPEFLDINNNYYNAEVRALDFGSPEALDIINGWVADQTDDKIEKIIDEIDPAHIMFLINAIYFKGIWSVEFKKENTHDGIFHLHNGSEKTVKMMNQEADLGYFENDLFQACEMDYGRGNFSMLVLLPKENIDLESFTDELTNSNWDSWTTSITQHKVNITLPKFTFKYDKELNEILSLMGMRIAFGYQADFSGINGIGGLYIDYVKHSTFVEVNEEGTEAAAATVVAIREFAVADGPVYMVVNRPFIFAIREKTTNTIVFLGKVAEPKLE